MNIELRIKYDLLVDKGMLINTVLCFYFHSFELLLSNIYSIHYQHFVQLLDVQ